MKNSVIMQWKKKAHSTHTKTLPKKLSYSLLLLTGLKVIRVYECLFIPIPFFVTKI